MLITALSRPPLPREGERFQQLQDEFFEQADAQHFAWQTRNRVIARTERELLHGFPIPAQGRLLEVGCGEGGNLVNLRIDERTRPSLIAGLDYSRHKVDFAKLQVPEASFVCADAAAIPFDDGYFDAVLCRDVLHHLADRRAALHEIRRVCKKSGTVWIFEPNAANPLMWLLAKLRPHERGLLANSPRSLRDLVGAHFSDVSVEMRQPMPIYRLLLHQQLGLATLGQYGIVDALAAFWDRTLALLTPRRWWAYIVVKASP